MRIRIQSDIPAIVGSVMMMAMVAVSLLHASSYAARRVVVLPFEDRVRLSEAWDLSVDVPRWFATTIDTVGRDKKAISVVAFDSVLSLIKSNGWGRDEYREQKVLRRIATMFKADFVIYGAVSKFSVMKRAMNTDADVAVTHSLSGTASGSGGATVMGALHSQSAKIKIEIEIHSAATGALTDRLDLDSEQKEGGLKVWLPFQTENDETNFHYLSRTPFGSVYFRKSVAGAVMRHFSLKLHDALVSGVTVSDSGSASDLSHHELLEGKILERSGSEVYLNLGSADYLFRGEFLEVLKPDRPIVAENGDTLGWVELSTGTIQVRSLKSSHFSVGFIIQESDSIRAGWAVRPPKTAGK